VIIDASRTETVDGERGVAEVRKPIGPGDHRAVEAATAMQQDDRRKWSCSLWSRHVADQPNRLRPAPALDLDELAGRCVGAGNGHDGNQAR
jgi:uncharacterized protein YceK